MKLAMVPRADLISKAYRKEQERLHADPRGYGGKGFGWTEAVDNLAKAFDCRRVLDYGCGQGTLGAALRKRGYVVQDYDPAVKAFSADPEPADLVNCTDVMEHLEIDKVGAVLHHLYLLTGKVLFTVISTVETAKTLSDGRQAHITLHPFEWWEEQMAKAYLFPLPIDIPNPKPEKQIIQVWQPLNGGI